ncbi:MAG: hypothetical protein WBC06_18435 [Chitinophagaceae bacterium]
MMTIIRRLIFFLFLSAFFTESPAQQLKNESFYKEAKPFKVLTSGKQITIKSTKDINHVMLWTNNGDRLVEQKEINATSYSFRIPINGRFFFLMVGLTNGKIYTEKIGLRE